VEGVPLQRSSSSSGINSHGNGRGHTPEHGKVSPHPHSFDAIIAAAAEVSLQKQASDGTLMMLLDDPGAQRLL